MNKKSVISTVTGDIASDSLGMCQCHEHIMLRRGVPASINPVLCMDDVGKSLTEVSAFRQAGGRAIVDAQPIGCGRMPAELARIAQEADVHIIASTGFYLLRFYPSEHWLHSQSESQLEELFCQELTQGMYENADITLAGPTVGQRAGLIKTACEGESLSPFHRKAFTAAAKASQLCGVPIMIHVEPGSNPLALFSFLTGLGVLPDRLIFCHLDRAIPEESVAHQLCREGAYVEYDTIGRWKYHSDETEIALIQRLLDLGYQDRLLLSLDTTNQRMLAYGGSVGLTYLIKQFLPALLRAGVSEDILRIITQVNPACVLEKRWVGE